MARPRKTTKVAKKATSGKTAYKVSTKKKTTNTQNATDLRSNALSIGDQCKDMFDGSKDLKAAQMALKGYATANSIIKSQLVYKKMAGKPATVKFLED
jgi:hypothetical protein